MWIHSHKLIDLYVKIGAFLAVQFACMAKDLFRQSHLTVRNLSYVILHNIKGRTSGVIWLFQDMLHSAKSTSF